jgi:formylglycine-generating enzyme required for sulfatase activity
MTGELEVSIPDAIKVGEIGTIRVTNRTTGIVSELSVTDGAVFVSGQQPFVEVSTFGSYAYLDHSSNPEKKYYETRTIQLKPKLPVGVSSKVVTVRVEVGGKRYSKRVNIGTSNAPLLAQYKKEMRDINGQFKMGRTEVTVGMWKQYCQIVGKEMPVNTPSWGWIDSHPMVLVSWYDCKDYAEWAGLRLPTGNEWELAATGGDGRNHPWGGYGDGYWDQVKGYFITAGWDPSKCVCVERGDRSTAPVGSIPDGDSPFGCSDMSGNVEEWCANDYLGGKEVRGGSLWREFPEYFRCARRDWEEPEYWNNQYVGFRLAGPI